MVHAVEHVGLFVIFGLVLVPVYLMFAGWLIGKPRDYRTVGIAMGYLLGFAVAAILGVAVLGVIISGIIAV